jgi:hypothetical protein
VALKDLSNNLDKIQSFRYDKIEASSKQPQTINDNKGTIVEGGTSKLLDRVSAKIANNDGNGYGKIVSAIDNVTNPQTFTIENRAGSATITGLSGQVNSDTDLGETKTDIQIAKDASLLMSTWAESFNGSNVYSVPRKINPTSGHNELTFTYGDVPDPSDGDVIERVNGAIERFLFGPPRGRGLGALSESSQPTRFSKEFGTDWTVNTAFGHTRGGSATDAIVNNYTDLVTKSSWWSNFVSKQSNLQSDFAIMKGSTSLGDAPFDQFDGSGIAVGFSPGSRGVRIGNLFQGVPRYTETAPLINKDNFESVAIGTDYSKDKFSGFLEPNFGEVPKMAYLYQNYVVSQQDDPVEGGITSMITSFIDNSLTPYPIAPTVNVVKSGQKVSNFDDFDSDGNLAKRYSLLGLKDLPVSESLDGKYDTNLVSPYENKYLGEDPNGPKDTLIKKRQDGREKVYAIGRQGFRGVDDNVIKVAKPDDAGDWFTGLIKKQGTSNKTDATDKINMIPYGSVSGSAGLTIEDDFIPLRFHDIFNERDIVFRAIIDGDITDTVTPGWQDQTFIGRPVKSATYTGVERSIGFGFQVYPKSKQEFPVLLEKVNYLVGLCYPHFDRFYRQTGPMIKLTLGDIVDHQMGYITSCTVTFPGDSTWETDKGLRFTKQINVSVEFAFIGGNIPVATGKHYGLPWLDGTKYDENGVNFESPKDIKRGDNYNKLFDELYPGSE